MVDALTNTAEAAMTMPLESEASNGTQAFADNIPDGANLAVSVKDFGPIRDGRIELRPLTVLVGPNNTGKSYFSKLVYALHKWFQGVPSDRSLPHKPPPLLDAIEPLIDAENDQFSDWLDRYMSARPSSPDQIPPYPELVEARIARHVAEMPGHDSALGESLLRCLGVRELRKLVRGVPDESPHARISVHAPTGQLDVSMSSSSEIALQTRVSPGFVHRPAPELPMMVPLDLLQTWDDRRRQAFQQGLFFGLSNLAVRTHYDRLSRMIHYIPDNRPGILGAHRVIISMLVAQAAYGRIPRQTPTPDLSGTDADFLQMLIELGTNPGEYDGFATRIEKDILGGEIRVERTKDSLLPVFSYRPRLREGNLDVAMVSSSAMVSELAPIVLLLRHVARPGDLLIIEEPETHLHPALQAKLVVQLASLVSAGLRVVVTTHSEWVLNQFSNLVALSALSEPSRRSIEESHPQLRGGALAAKDVGMWLFSPGKERDGSTITEIRFDEETSDYSPGFSEVGSELYNEWAEIASLIEGGKGT